MDIMPGGWGYDSAPTLSNYASGERQGPASSRSEQLFYAEDYRIFFLTGQYQDATDRNTGIAVRPCHDFEPGTIESMKAQALAWTSGRNHEVTISVRDTSLVLRDGVTAAESVFPVWDLDADIASKYAACRVSAAWAKYAPPSADPGKAVPKKQNALKL